MAKPIASVDFDGTIVDHDFPRIGKLKPGVKEQLDRLSKEYWIIISSCRNSSLWSEKERKQYLWEMEECLRKNEIPYNEIDAGTKGKIFADVYIDDKGVRFEEDWKAVVDLLIGQEEL